MITRTRCTILGLCTLVALAAGAPSGPASAAGAPTQATRTITLEGARRVLAAADREAAARQVGGAFAVVDAGGNLVAMERRDGTFAAGAHVSVDKARTAALFRRPTRAFEDAIRNGRTAMLGLTDFTPLQGGIPIVVDGEVIGAVGVSGASSAQEDDELAMIAAAALGTDDAATTLAAPEAVTTVFLDSETVRSAFARGMPLLENEAYKVHASRRDAAGQAEVHADETDIIYVIEGAATLVTGGEVMNGVPTAPREVRGSGITGGQARGLKAGDVVVIPAGTPHWFQTVDGPFLYFVVKVVKA